MKDSRPIHVLMTVDAMGGAWTYALALASALRPADVSFTFAAMGPHLSDADRARANALPHVALHVRSYRLEWMPDSDLDIDMSSHWLQRLADRIAPDIVHVNGYAHAAVPFGRPVLTVAHGCVRSRWRAVTREPAPDHWTDYTHRVRAGLAASTYVVAPTQAMADALRREYAFTGPVAVVPNGLPPPCSLPLASSAPKESCIFAAGRFWDDAKNLAALDEIAPALRWPIIAAGSIEAPDRTRRTPRHVWHLGQIDRAEVQERMARAAIYVHPALYEPFGLSILEAAQAGCALVLGDIPSLREIWGDAALYVDPNDRVALRDTLAYLIAHQPLRARLASGACARASALTDRQMAERYLAIYHALADRDVADAHDARDAAIANVPAMIAKENEVAACGS